jgi:ribonucleotide monophosphatase NagD (HAD superfamily)
MGHNLYPQSKCPDYDEWSGKLNPQGISIVFAVNFDMIKKAASLIKNGSRFIGTNPDMVDPCSDGFEPACGVFLKAIEVASGKAPYVVEKPVEVISGAEARRRAENKAKRDADKAKKAIEA